MAERHRFGSKIAFSSDGTRLAVGAPRKENDNGERVGKVQIFDWIDKENAWNQVGMDLMGMKAGDCFGFTLAFSSDGTRLAIGSISAGNNGMDYAGLVQVFDWKGNSWSQVGNNLTRSLPYDEFGRSLALSSNGTRLAIASNGTPIVEPDDDTELQQAGVVQVYEWTTTTTTSREKDNSSSSWIQVGDDLCGTFSEGYFGEAIAFSADGIRLAVGVPWMEDSESGDLAGLVQIFDWMTDQNRWTKVGNDLRGIVTYDEYGRALALSSDGTRLVVGGPGNITVNTTDPGLIQIYSWIGNSWSQIGPNLRGIPAGDEFGSTIAFSSDGTRVAIGSPLNNQKTGMVQVFYWDETSWIQVGNNLTGTSVNDFFGTSLAFSSDGSRLAVGVLRNCERDGLVQVFGWTGNSWTQVGNNVTGTEESEAKRQRTNDKSM